LLRPAVYLALAATAILIVRSVFFLHSSDMIDLRANCVAHYKMNDKAPSPVVVDSSGNGCHGESYRNTEDMHTDGKIDGALSFNGSSDYVDTNSAFQSVFRNDFSINLWVKLMDGNPQSPQSIIGYCGDNDMIVVRLSVTGKIQFTYLVDGAQGCFLETEALFGDGEQSWAMLTVEIMQVDKTHINGRVYVNSILRCSVPDDAANMQDYGGDILYVGCANAYGVEPYQFCNCIIDDAMIFNKALSQEEKEFLYNNGDGTEYLTDHYRVFRGQDGNFDYDEPVAEMAYDDLQISIPEQDLPANTIWHYVRRRVAGCCNKESPDSPVCIVRIDSNGDMIGNIPNSPTNLITERLSEGKVKLRWRYIKLEEEIAPTGFHIYIDSGAGFDFKTPDGTVLYHHGGPKAGEFDWTSDSLSHGELYRFCVRSHRTGSGESQNTNFVSAVADAVGPEAITDLLTSVEEI